MGNESSKCPKCCNSFNTVRTPKCCNTCGFTICQSCVQIMVNQNQTDCPCCKKKNSFMDTKLAQATIEQLTKLHLENQELKNRLQAEEQRNQQTSLSQQDDQINRLILVVRGLPSGITKEEVERIFPQARFPGIHQITLKPDKCEVQLHFTKPELSESPLREMNGVWYKTDQLKLAYMMKKPTTQPQQNQQKPSQANPNAEARPPPATAQKSQMQQQQQGNKNPNQKGQQSKPANQPNQQQQQKSQKNPKQQNQGNQNQRPVPQPLIPAQPPQAQMVAMAPVQQGNQVVYVPVAQMPQVMTQPPSYLMSTTSPTMMQPMQLPQMNPMMQAAPPPYSPDPQQHQQEYSGKGNQNRQHNNPGGTQKGKQKQGGQILKNKLFITYLPDSVTNMSLHQMFSKFGITKEAKLYTGKGDKPPSGVVLFEKDHEAAAALNALNGSMIGNRKLTVKYYVDYGHK